MRLAQPHYDAVVKPNICPIKLNIGANSIIRKGPMNDIMPMTPIKASPDIALIMFCLPR